MVWGAGRSPPGKQKLNFFELCKLCQETWHDVKHMFAIEDSPKTVVEETLQAAHAAGISDKSLEEHAAQEMRRLSLEDYV